MKMSVYLALAGLALLCLIFAGVRYAYPKITLFSPSKVAHNFARMPEIFPSNRIVHSTNPKPFETAIRPLPDRLVFGGETHMLNDFLIDTHTSSLTVIKDGVIIAEQYFQGYDSDSRPTSFSVAKSFVSTMVGIALERGMITSLNDKVTTYLPELQGSGFENVRIVDLLQMSSGIDFSEDYQDTTTDAFTIFDQIFIYMRSIDRQAGRYGSQLTPGTTFQYASINSHVLSMLIRRVSGLSLADFMQRYLWDPLGAEDDAFWLTDNHGTEIGFWGLNAHPRDFARLGLLMLANGYVDDQRLLPDGWVDRATLPDKPYLQPGQTDGDWGYQYQWWAPKGGEGQDFSAIGIWGQFIYVNRAANLVIVKTSSDADFKAHEYQTILMFRALASWLEQSAPE